MEELTVCPICSSKIDVYYGGDWTTFYCTNHVLDIKTIHKLVYDRAHYSRFTFKEEKRYDIPYDNLHVEKYIVKVHRFKSGHKTLSIGSEDGIYSGNNTFRIVFIEPFNGDISMFDSVDKIEEFIQNYKMIS